MSHRDDSAAKHLKGTGWCHHPDHGRERHTLDRECVDPETVNERIVAMFQYRVDLQFWDIVTHYK